MDDQIDIYFSENHIMFKFDDTTVVSRLIDGEYFRIDQMLSSDYETKVTINKKEFLDIHVVELHFQRVRLEAFAVAGFAFQYKVCHELHLHRDGAFTLAFLATAAFAVEAEVSGTVSHLLGKRLVRP